MMSLMYIMANCVEKHAKGAEFQKEWWFLRYNTIEWRDITQLSYITLHDGVINIGYNTMLQNIICQFIKIVYICIKVEVEHNYIII